MHTSPVLFEALRLIEDAGLTAWLAGGWGEELRGLIAPRAHQDIDLLYPAEDFTAVDVFFRACLQVSEIQAKHFSHKRAMLYQGVMVEFLLVRAGQTSFFDGRHIFTWPEDVFAEPVVVEGFGPLRIASKKALVEYRANHPQVLRAFQAVAGTR